MIHRKWHIGLALGALTWLSWGQPTLVDAQGCNLGPITGLTCTVSGNDVTLDWVNGDMYTAIFIFRDGALIDTVSGADSTYVDLDVQVGNHFWEVSAVAGSECADGDCCFMPIGPCPDNPPADLGGGTSGGNMVNLTWTNPMSYAIIRVYRMGPKTAPIIPPTYLPGFGCNDTTLASLTLNPTSYVDTPSVAGYYYYQLEAFDSNDTTCGISDVCCVLVGKGGAGAQSQSPPTVIPEGAPGLLDFIDFVDPVTITDLQVGVQITHSFVGQLVIDLISPGGTGIVLHDQHGGATDDMDVIFAQAGPSDTFSSYKKCRCPRRPGPGDLGDFTAESMQGPWSLGVLDAVPGESGSLEGWSIQNVTDLRPDPVIVNCATAGGVPTLEVDLAEAFDALEIVRDGVVVDTMPGPVGPGLLAYLDMGPCAGVYRYEVRAVDAVLGLSFPSNSCRVEFGTALTAQGNSFGPPLPIPDPGQLFESVSFMQSEIISDLDVSVEITHTFVGDLNVAVASPKGTTVTLHAREGGGGQDLHVTYDDQGIANSPPYDCNCAMQPSGPGALCDFNGEDLVGDWQLIVADEVAGNSGALDSWSITSYSPASCTITAPTGLTCTDSGDIVDIFWTNTGLYDAIELYRDGALLATLPGTETGFGDVPEIGLHTYFVRGISFATLPCCHRDSTPCTVDRGAPTEYCNPGLLLPIPDGDALGLTDTVMIPGQIIGDIQVEVQILHPSVGELMVTVTSPSMTSVTLHELQGGDLDNLRAIFDDDGFAQGLVPYDCNCLLQPSGPGQMADFLGEDAGGAWQLSAVDLVPGNPGELEFWCVKIREAEGELFIRGDCDGDGTFNGVLDALTALNFQFSGGMEPPCLRACDVDGDRVFNGLLDGLRALNFQFVPGTAPPPSPYPGCGTDTNQTISCNELPIGCNP